MCRPAWLCRPAHHPCHARLRLATKIPATPSTANPAAMVCIGEGILYETAASSVCAVSGRCASCAGAIDKNTSMPNHARRFDHFFIILWFYRPHPAQYAISPYKIDLYGSLSAKKWGGSMMAGETAPWRGGKVINPSCLLSSTCNTRTYTPEIALTKYNTYTSPLPQSTAFILSSSRSKRCARHGPLSYYRHDIEHCTYPNGKNQ